jgi:glycosyltransferase involved in cell wall biosynthesis
VRVTVLTTDVGERGGVQRYGAALVQALRSLGHDVDLHLTVDVRSPIAKASAAARLIGGASRSDLVWVGHPRLGPLGLIAARATRHPFVISTYGFETWLPYPRAWRFALEHADAVTAISGHTCERMGPSGSRAVLLPPTWGVDARTVEPMPDYDQRDAIVLVTRLDEPYKGASIFLDLAERSDREGLTFVLAGSGAPGTLAARIDHLRNARLCVDPDDTTLAGLYLRARAVLLPSRATRAADGQWTGGEGFGIVLLEAALAGAPVIASDEGACPETVGLLGNGLVTNATAAAFATALDSLLDDRESWDAFASTGRRRAEDFSPNRFVQRVAAVLAPFSGQAHPARAAD